MKTWTMAFWHRKMRQAGAVIDTNGREPFVRNCHIKMRKGDEGYLFNGTTGQCFLDGYAIIPIEEYESASPSTGARDE